MAMNLDAAIRLIKRVTITNDPWTGADISEDAKTATDTDDAIAAILNAVVAGDLAPPEDAQADPVREAAIRLVNEIARNADFPASFTAMALAVELQRALAGDQQ